MPLADVTQPVTVIETPEPAPVRIGSIDVGPDGAPTLWRRPASTTTEAKMRPIR